jgi:hypothetical protein
MRAESPAAAGRAITGTTIARNASHAASAPTPAAQGGRRP